MYDVQRKCIRLLDDGSGEEDLLSKYNFGSSPELLFRPCLVLPKKKDVLDKESDVTSKTTGIHTSSVVDSPIIRLPPDGLLTKSVPVSFNYSKDSVNP